MTCKGAIIMSKSKNTAPNNGRNRAEKRAAAHNPQPKKSSKPVWLRIMIVAIMVVMLLGFFIFPLMR